MLGPEMLQNGVLEASWGHFPRWAQKCFKIVSLRLPGDIFRAGPRNAPKWSPFGFLVAFSALGPEMLQNGVLEASWGHFPRWAQKCFKIVSLRLPGDIFRAGPRNAPKWYPGGFLRAFSACNSVWLFKYSCSVVTLQFSCSNLGPNFQKF